MIIINTIITFIIETVYRFVNTGTKICMFHQLHVELCNSINEELSTFVENFEVLFKKRAGVFY
jgi:hypothetical protein